MSHSVWISKQMNNHSFLPSFIPSSCIIFTPTTSAFYSLPFHWKVSKSKVNHFLYVDKLTVSLWLYITRPLGNITHGWSCPPTWNMFFSRLQHTVLTCVFLYFHCLLSVYFLVYTVFASYQTFEPQYPRTCCMTCSNSVYHSLVISLLLQLKYHLCRLWNSPVPIVTLTWTSLGCTKLLNSSI